MVSTDPFNTGDVQKYYLMCTKLLSRKFLFLCLESHDMKKTWKIGQSLFCSYFFQKQVHALQFFYYFYGIASGVRNKYLKYGYVLQGNIFTFIHDLARVNFVLFTFTLQHLSGCSQTIFGNNISTRFCVCLVKGYLSWTVKKLYKICICGVNYLLIFLKYTSKTEVL